MKKAADILRGLLGNEQAAIAGRWSAFFSGWEKLVGTDIASHSRVIDVKRGVVIVEVDHPGWLQVLQMNREQILTGMKKSYPSLGIQNMRVFVGDGKVEEKDQDSDDEATTSSLQNDIDREEVENSEEYQRFKQMLERLRNTERQDS